MLIKHVSVILLISAGIVLGGCNRMLPASPQTSETEQLNKPFLSQPEMLSEIDAELLTTADDHSKPGKYEYTIEIHGNQKTTHTVWYRENQGWNYEVFMSKWSRQVTVEGSAGAVYTSNIIDSEAQPKTIRVKKDTQLLCAQKFNTNEAYVITY